MKEDIGNKIRKSRIEKEITQIRLSEETGINQQTIIRIEQGKSNPSIKTLKSICEGLDVSADYLLGIKKKKEKEFQLTFEELLDLVSEALNWEPEDEDFNLSPEDQARLFLQYYYVY